jgi:hypothetical protein
MSATFGTWCRGGKVSSQWIDITFFLFPIYPFISSSIFILLNNKQAKITR